MESDAPDALPKSELGSMFLVDGDPSIREELQGQGGNLSTSSDLTRDVRDASTLPKDTLNHPANIQNVRASFFHPHFFLLNALAHHIFLSVCHLSLVNYYLSFTVVQLNF